MKEGISGFGGHTIPPVCNLEATTETATANTIGNETVLYLQQARNLAHDCKATKSESRGRQAPYKPKLANTKQVQATQNTGVPASPERPNPMEFLYSSDSEDDSEVRVVRVTDGGSVSQCVRLQIQGVPVFGIIDSGADITIMVVNCSKR